MMRSLYIVVLLLVSPLSACAKNDAEMCEEMARHMAKLVTLNEAPMDARPELIEHQIQNRLHSKQHQAWVNNCIVKKIASNNIKNYECRIAAKTWNEGFGCDEKFPIKPDSR